MLRESPVLLITFNRPHETKEVLKKIKEAKIRKLYIAKDGARKGNEDDIEASKQIENLINDHIDWDCEVHKRFLTENHGCGYGVSSAISWAFTDEDRLIILEDDCVPSLPFFGFCNYNLEKYKNDARVWTINGRSHHSNDYNFNYDYLFSQYFHSHGWATWKRVWGNFDIKMPENDNFLKDGGFYNVFFSKKEATMFNKKFEKHFTNQTLVRHSWAYPFFYYVCSNRGLSITPSKNLIHNIGYEGVHSNGRVTYLHKIEACEDYSINDEPLFVLPDRKYDYLHYKKHMKRIMGGSIFVRNLKKLSKYLNIYGFLRKLYYNNSKNK